MNGMERDAPAARPAPLPTAPLDDAQRLACLRLIRSENVGPVTFRELVNHFGGAQAALDALPELSARNGRGRPVRICPRDVAEAELAAAARVGATPLFTIEPGYPVPLAHLAVPPPMLYVRGRVELLARPTVAVVGARNGSAAGLRLTRMLSAGLGDAGFVVASGLARGIDGAAHEAALAAGTIAVLAGGIDFQYPPEHEALQERIAREGCLVSEQPPGFQPRGQDFPRRNRIVSGLSLAVVVVEAAKRSGSLITARMAAEQGRLVLAVPGHPLDPRAEGTNGLIRQGAGMVTSVEDLVAEVAPLVGQAIVREAPTPTDALPDGAAAAAPSYPPLSGAPRPSEARLPARAAAPDALQPSAPERHAQQASPGLPPPGAEISEATARVLAVLGPAPANIDELARAAGVPMALVRVALLELALAGRIEQHGANLVSLTEPPGG